MCGIFGLIRKDGNPVERGIVTTCTRMLTHRGPDGEGYFTSNNIGLGHRRLKIIDLSDRGAQPMHKHDLSIIYNGELYNYKSLRTELISDGYEFKSDSDTEVILSGYKKWGIDLFSKMNGMWALCMVDHRSETVICSRDRYGMKPLYLYDSDLYMAFSSEIKAFKKLDDWKTKWNQKSINEFLVEGKLHNSNSTFYDGVSMLDAASYSIYTIDGKLKEVSSYYSIDIKDNSNVSQQLTQEKFAQAIDRHYISDVPVACALSGGIDSSSIVAQAAKSEKPLSTFSYIPLETQYSEQKYIDEVKDAYHQENYSVSPGFDAHIAAHQSVLEANEAPALAMNLISAYLLYEKVKDQNYSVLLSGQGADELLLGYNFYHKYYLKHLLNDRKVFRFLVELFYLAIKHPTKIFRSKKPFSYAKFVNSSHVINSQEQEFYQYYLGEGHLHTLLQLEDRMGMAHGVEGRFPFLDLDFSNHLHQVPNNLKIKNGVKKWIFRKAMRGITPDIILDRPDKMGYVSPQETWMYEHRAHFIMKINNGLKGHQGIFDSSLLSFVKEVLEKDQKQHFSFIWRVYSFLEFLDLEKG